MNWYIAQVETLVLEFLDAPHSRRPNEEYGAVGLRGGRGDHLPAELYHGGGVVSIARPSDGFRLQDKFVVDARTDVRVRKRWDGGTDDGEYIGQLDLSCDGVWEESTE